MLHDLLGHLGDMKKYENNFKMQFMYIYIIHAVYQIQYWMLFGSSSHNNCCLLRGLDHQSSLIAVVHAGFFPQKDVPTPFLVVHQSNKRKKNKTRCRKNRDQALNSKTHQNDFGLQSLIKNQRLTWIPLPQSSLPLLSFHEGEQ